jgi:leucyl aminopeptidase
MTAARARPPGEVRLLVAGPASTRTRSRRPGPGGRGGARPADLTNTPSGRKNPAWLADQAVGGGRRRGLTVRVWDADELAAQGFGGLIAVGSGSASPPR